MKENYFVDYSYCVEVKDGIIIAKSTCPIMTNGTAPLVKIIKENNIKVIFEDQLLDTLVKCVETNEYYLTQKRMLRQFTINEVSKYRRQVEEHKRQILYYGING